jgi:AraC-like DNA-binding protein
MSEQATWLFVFVNSCSLLGLIVACILFWVNRSFSPRILALVIVCMSYSLFGYGLYISTEFLRYPHLWRTPVFFSLCVAPLTYIYVRSVLEQSCTLKRKDLLLFLPAVLYTAQLVPFYILPASEKILYIRNAMASKSYGASEHEGLIPPGIAAIFRMTYSLSVITYTFYAVFRWKAINKSTLFTQKENRVIFSWLLYLSTVLLLNFASLVVGYALNLNGILQQLRLPTVTVMFSLLSVCLYLLFKPAILYGLVSDAPMPVAANPGNGLEKELADKDPKRVFITKEMAEEYRRLLEDHFDCNAPFLRPRYSIKHLAEEIGVPSYLISSFINQEYGKNFNEFVNDRRLDHLIARVAKEPEILHFTLEVLGKMGGFNSRTAFIEAVKRKTGKMPSEIFLKETY